MSGTGLAAIVAALIAAAASVSGGVEATVPPIVTSIPPPVFDSAAGEGQPRPAALPWLRKSRPLGPAAPRWARRLYRRSLLVLRALTDPESGAQVAGATEKWNQVWPRDAAAGALAMAAAGHRDEAASIVEFLSGLDLDALAHFDPDGEGLPGRGAAGDAVGWVEAAADSVGADVTLPSLDWEDRQDYGENVDDDLLGNAIAAGAPVSEIVERYATSRGLTRFEGGPALDSAAAWAVVPFERPGLRSEARRTLLSLAAGASRYGIAPVEDWTPDEAWTAPTAWSAWALARLGERRAADRLLLGLRRAATSAGTLPERVATDSGRPLSITPLAWSHAFAVLALRSRYP